MLRFGELEYEDEELATALKTATMMKVVYSIDAAGVVGMAIEEDMAWKQKRRQEQVKLFTVEKAGGRGCCQLAGLILQNTQIRKRPGARSHEIQSKIGSYREKSRKAAEESDEEPDGWERVVSVGYWLGKSCGCILEA